MDPTLAQATLVPSGTTDPPYKDFGDAVAVATAGGVTTVVVGAPGKFINGNGTQGAAYVFTGSGGTYTQQARLIASDGAAQNGFGSSVAVAMDGATTTVVVGRRLRASATPAAPGNGPEQGRTSIPAVATTYTEQAILRPSTVRRQLLRLQRRRHHRRHDGDHRRRRPALDLSRLRQSDHRHRLPLRGQRRLLHAAGHASRPARSRTAPTSAGSVALARNGNDEHARRRRTGCQQQ